MRALAIQIMFLLAIFMACNLASECYAEVDGNIVLWLRFDEGKGDVAKDSSNYKHDGTITEAKWVEGKFGSALSFDGINDIVEVKSTNDLQLSGEGITIAVWFKTTETVRADLMFIEKGAWDPGEYALSYPGYANKRVRFQIYQIYGKETSQIDSVSGVPELSDDEWHHAAGVYDAASHIFRVYVDGVLEEEQGANPHVFSPDDQSVFIGSRNNQSLYYFGEIDELLVAKVPFTDEQILRHMKGNLFAVNTSGKLATKWGEIKKQQ